MAWKWMNVNIQREDLPPPPPPPSSLKIQDPAAGRVKLLNLPRAFLTYAQNTITATEHFIFQFSLAVAFHCILEKCVFIFETALHELKIRHCARDYKNVRNYQTIQVKSSCSWSLEEPFTLFWNSCAKYLVLFIKQYFWSTLKTDYSRFSLCHA